jgi:hypothetical protein
LPNAYDINVDALRFFFLFVVLLFHSDLDIVVVVVDVVVDVVAVFVVVLLDLLFSLVEAGCGLSKRFLQEKQPQATSNSTFFQPLQVAAPAHFQREQPAPHALGHVARLKE